MTKKCGHCGAPDSEDNRLSRCTGCSKVLYCSDICQKSAWSQHKKRCRRASIKEETLLLKDDQLKNFDLALKHANKHKPNIKHVELIIKHDDSEDESKEGVVLTADTLQSFLEINKGQLQTVFWQMDDQIIYNSGEKTKEGQIWTSLHGLKVLRMQRTVFSKSQDLVAVIRQQERSIRSLELTNLALGHDMNIEPWSRRDCKLLSTSISRCVNLVRLELGVNYLRDDDLAIMLPCLPGLRILGLMGRRGKAYLTDRSCKLISRTCPSLHELDIAYHRRITAPGIKRVLKGCQQLRTLETSVRLQPNDIKSLLSLAPNLVFLHTESRFDEAIFLDALKETGGRLILDWFNNNGNDAGAGADNVYNIKGLPAEILKEYRRSQVTYSKMSRNFFNPRVINEWEGTLVD